jgi:DNA replication protein DnaC
VTESLLPLYYAHRERAELRLQEAMDVDFLLFDDFGQEALPPASSEGPSIWQQRVHAVVLHRYLHRMLTAFTSNAPVASLQKHYAPPVLDRISGGSLYWVRTGKGSLRRP